MEIIKLAAAAILKRAGIVPFGPPDQNWSRYITRGRYNNPFNINPDRLPTAYGHVNPNSARYRWQDELPGKDLYERPSDTGRDLNLSQPDNISQLLNSIQAARNTRGNRVSNQAEKFLKSLPL